MKGLVPFVFRGPLSSDLQHHLEHGERLPADVCVLVVFEAAHHDDDELLSRAYLVVAEEEGLGVLGLAQVEEVVEDGQRFCLELSAGAVELEEDVLPELGRGDHLPHVVRGGHDVRDGPEDRALDAEVAVAFDEHEE